MRKTLSVFLAVLMLVGTFSVLAFAADESDLQYTCNEDRDYIISGCSADAEGELVLPHIKDETPVVGIWAGAFSNCPKLTSFSMPDGYCNVGADAFKGTAFYNDSKNWTDGMLYVSNWLVATKPEELPSYPVIRKGTVGIADGAFSHSSIKDVSFPSSLVRIGNDAFCYCDNLESVELPSSTLVIGKRSFSHDKSLKAFISWNSDLYIGNGTFFNDYSKLVLFGYESSRIKGYAEDNNLYFLSLEEYMDSIYPVLSSVTNTENGIQFNWLTDGSFDHFVVYRKVGSGKWEKVRTVGGNESSYLDTNVKAGMDYTYTVRGTYYDLRTTYDPGLNTRRLTQPSLSSVTNTTAGAVLKWSTVTKADGYYIYRKAAGETAYKKVGSTSSGSDTSFMDKAVKSGVTYTYRVRAYCNTLADIKTGKKTMQYSSFDNTGISNLFLSAPTVKAATAANGVRISWNAVGGAEGYTVYYKTKTGWAKLTSTGKATTSVIDSAVMSGKTYTYTVRADAAAARSSFTSGGSALYLSTPPLKSVAKTRNGLCVNYGAVTGAKGYVIYRKTGSSNWNAIATLNNGGMVSYNDTTANKGVTYSYTVRAYNGSVKSGFEAGLSAKR